MYEPQIPWLPSLQDRLHTALLLRQYVQSFETVPRTLHIYHFTKTRTNIPSPTHGLVEYVNILFSKATEALALILDQASNHSGPFERTLIVSTSSTKSGSIAHSVNEALADFYDKNDALEEVNRKSLYSITILHLTDSAETVIYDAFNVTKPSAHDKKVMHVYVRKIVNVILVEQNSTIRSTHYFTATAKSHGRPYSYKYLHVNDAKSRGGLDGQWWYVMYNLVPVCADGRLTQSTGTCWWNTSANIMILTQPIAALLKIQWHNLKGADITYTGSIEKTPLTACLQRRLPPMDFMMVLTYQLLIKGQRARSWQNNLSAQGAGYFINSDTSTSTYQNLKQEEILLLKNKVRSSRALATTSNKLVQYEDGGYSALAGITTFMQALLQYGEHFSFLNIIHADQVQDFNNGHLVWETSDDWNAETIELWTLRPFPLIVVLNMLGTDLDNCPSTISVNGAPYDLQSSAILVDDFHVMAGVTCETQTINRYVFDSNNVIGLDDWTKLKRGQDASNRSVLSAYNTAYKRRFPDVPAPSQYEFHFLVYFLRPEATSE